MKRIHSLILFFLSVSILEANAQPTHFRFQHLTVEDGLSQDIVTAIAQDGLGFMWFATEDGLNVYDGYSFTVFKHLAGDSSSLSANSVASLLADHHGHLWVATASGADIIDIRTRSIRHVYSTRGVRLDEVNGFCPAGGDDVWISTMHGLFRTHGTTAERAQLLGMPTSDTIWGLYAEAPDRIWYISPAGLYCCRPVHDTLVPVELPEAFRREIRGHRISNVYRDQRQGVWICTGDAGIFRFDPTLHPKGRYQASSKDPRALRDNGVRLCVEDRSGRLWFGTMSGLETLDPLSDRMTHVPSEPASSAGFMGDRTYAFCLDRAGILWIGTYRGGINTYAPNREKFRLYPLTGETSARGAYAVLETSDGTLLAGTEDGVCSPRTRPGERLWKRVPGFEGKNVFSLCQTRNGEIWVGTAGWIGTLPGWTSRPRRFRLPMPDPVHCIYEDTDGDLLIGTDLHGLYRLKRNGSAVEQWVPRGYKMEGGVWTMFQDRSGHLWIGSWTSRWFYKYDKLKDSLSRFGPGSEPGFAVASVKAFREDSAGNLWLGTWGTGLYRLDCETGEFTQYTEADGLANNFVKSVEIDRHGALWVGTERGLTWYDPLHRSFKTFTQRDGLQGNFFFSGASFKGRDGILYFGGPGGIVAFDPDSVRYNSNAPPVIITSFKIFDRPAPLLSQTGEIRPIVLRYDQVFFSFEFVALDFTDPLRNRYAYMLEGFDTAWVDAGNRHYASYTHLDPGAYTFRVKASNNDGIWNEEGASLAIVITPAFWTTWWFRGAIATALLLTSFAFYRTRIRTILEVERLRHRIARDLHDDIGTNLSAIVLASEMGGHLAGLPTGQTAFDEIRTVALVTQEHMRDIVWMLNPTNDSVELLVARMRDDAARLLRATPHNFQGPQGELPSRIELGLKRNIFLIYKEVLHNIVKHSEATCVDITMTLSDGRLELAVRDNGRGFDPETVIHGNGIDSISERARQIHADLQVTSRPGKGTQIRLTSKMT